MARVALAFAVVAFALPMLVLLSGTADAGAGARRIGVVTVAGALVLGVPAFIYFRCLGWWQLWKFMVGGALGGLLCAFVFLDIEAPNFVFLAFLFVAGGALHALVFWLIAIWRHPALTVPRRYCLPDGATYKVAHSTLRDLSRPRQ